MDKKQLFLDILFFLGFVLGGLFLAQFLAVVALLPFHEFKLTMVLAKINDPLGFPEMKMQLLAVQGISSFVSFVLAPLVYIKWKEKYWRAFLSTNSHLKYVYILPTVAIMIVSLPFVSFLVQWNESVHLPEYLTHIELWAKEKEEFLKKVTQLLTDLRTPYELLVGMVVIAFLPALGEELVFRGYLQNKLKLLFDSPHIAIWVSAFLFSAIHMQFYGFVPRMLLGAMFGYIYYFTGQFHLPVIAHFTNNGLMLLLMYFRSHGYIRFDIESEENVPFSLSLVSLVLTIFIFMLIMRQVKTSAIKS